MSEQYKTKVVNGKIYYYKDVKDIFGKRKHLTSATVQGLEEKIQRNIIETASGCASTKIKLGDYMRHWLDTVHYPGDLKETSIERYEASFSNQILGSEIADIPMRDLTVDIVQAYYIELYKRTSSSTVKNVHKILSPCLRYAYGRGSVLRDFSRQLKVPKDKKPQNANVRPLTRNEQILFVKAINGTNEEALFRTALDGGYRKGELLALTWNDVDLDNRTISINKTYSYIKDKYSGKYKGITTDPKTKNSRRKNRIPKALIPILREHKKNQQAGLMSYGLKQTGKTLVFSTVDGHHLDPSGVNKRVKKVFKNLGFDDGKHFHDLRHTYATRQFEIGKDNLDYTVVVVSKLLGHCNVKETLETYTTVLDDLRDAMADNTDALYDSLYANM